MKQEHLYDWPFTSEGCSYPPPSLPLFHLTTAVLTCQKSAAQVAWSSVDSCILRKFHLSIQPCCREETVVSPNQWEVKLISGEYLYLNHSAKLTNGRNKTYDYIKNSKYIHIHFIWLVYTHIYISINIVK